MAITKVTNSLVSVNAIHGTLIADNAITSVHIAQNQVTSVQIPDSSITSTQLAANSVDTAELISGSIDAIHLASDSVTTAKILNANVTTAKIANNSITSALIPDGSITDTQLGSGAFTMGTITTTGAIRGPASLTIDPATVGDNTGTVVIAGNLQVDGTTTTVNSTTLDVADKNITIGKGQNEAGSGGSGITVDGSNATILWDETNTSWDFNNPVTIERAATADMLIAETTSNNTRSFLTTKSKDSSGNSLQLKLGTLGDGPYGMLFTLTNHPLTFATNNAAPQMTLLTNGNFGIGTTSPTFGTLEVQGPKYVLTDSGQARGGIHISPDSSATSGQYGGAISLSGGGSGSVAIASINDGGSDHDSVGIAFITHPQGTGSADAEEKMRITEVGNVGIGTDSPGELLSLYKSSGTTLVQAAVHSNSTVGFEIKKTNATTQNWRIVDGQTVNGVLEFYDATNSATRMAIKGDGNVGIGTSNPTKRVQIESGSTDDDGLFLSHSDGTLYAKLAVKNPGVDNNTLFGAVSNNDLEIMTANAERMRVQSNGNVLIDCSLTSGAGISDGGFLFRTDTSGHRYMQISTGNTGDADVLYVYKKNGTGITGVGTLSTYGDGINLKGGNGLVSIGYGQTNFIEFLTSTGSGQPRIRPSAADTVDLGDTARRFKDLQLGGKIEFNKTNSSGGGDHDFIKMGYNGSWSNNTQGLAAISVDDGTGVVGKYGVTYDGSKGRFVITDMYHGGYANSGDVFWVRGNGEAHFAGGGGDALTIGDGESNYVTINNASSGDVSSGYNIKSGSTTTTSLYGNAGEGWTTLMSGGSLGFRVNQASSGFNPMNIDTSGRVSMPYQPCFCVVNPNGVFPNSTTEPFGKTGNGGTGAYTLRMNVGSHFSATTGRFTAPIAGNYYFSFSAMFDGSGSAGFDFKTNGTAVNGGEALDSSSDTYTQISGSILLALSANDYVTVVQRGRRIHQRYGSFEGFLVG